MAILLKHMSAPENIKELDSIKKIPTAKQMDEYIEYINKEVIENTFSMPPSNEDNIPQDYTISHYIGNKFTLNIRIKKNGELDSSIPMNTINGSRFGTPDSIDWSTADPFLSKFYQNVKLDIGQDIETNPLYVTDAIVPGNGITRCPKLYYHSQQIKHSIIQAIKNIFLYNNISMIEENTKSYTKYRTPEKVLRDAKIYIEKYGRENVELQASPILHDFMEGSHWGEEYKKLDFQRISGISNPETRIVPLAGRYNHDVQIFNSYDRVKGRWLLATIIILKWGTYIPTETETFFVGPFSYINKVTSRRAF